MKEIEVEALRPFNRTTQGDLVHPGDKPFKVGEVRAGELERLGLAKRTGKASRTETVSVPLEKAAPAPANKMAPEPANKAAVSPAVSAERIKRVKLSGGQV